MTFMDYIRLRTSQLQHLAGGGDADAKKELARRQREAPATFDFTTATFAQLRALVNAWRNGSTIVEKADSLHLARLAQDELVARWRTRSRLGWSKTDAETFGPEGLDALPVAPWTIPPAPRCISWKRPTGSTHYPSPESIEGAQLNDFARAYYKGAAGVPQK